MTEEDLRKKLTEVEKDLAKNRSLISSGESKRSRDIRSLRILRARILTVMNE